MIAGGDGRIDARSLRWQLAAVFGGGPAAHDPLDPRLARRLARPATRLFLVSIPVSVVLLAVYLVVTVRNLRIHQRRRPAKRLTRTRGRSERRSLLLVRGDGRHGLRLRGPRPLAQPLRRSGRAEPVLHRDRDRRDRRQRGRARRRRRDRAARQHDARDRDRDHVLDAGRGLRHAGRLPALVDRRHRPAALVSRDRDRDDAGRSRVRCDRHLGRAIATLGGVPARSAPTASPSSRTTWSRGATTSRP